MKISLSFKRPVMVIAVLLLSLILSGCGSSGGTADGTGGGSATTWGSHGTGNGQFDHPYGIALDEAGKVYVSDSNNGRIQKFSADGAFLDAWDLQPGSRALTPMGLVVSGSQVYVCDWSNARIQVFTTDGVYVTSWVVPDTNISSGDGQGYPIDIDVCADGTTFYVIDSIDRSILTYNSSGTVLGSFRIDRDGVGDWGPAGLAVKVNQAFVADDINNRVDCWDLSTGTLITSWGSTGSTDGLFNTPIGISLMGTDSIIVGDLNLSPVFGRIQKFNLTGTFQSKIQPEGGDLYPTSIAVNNSSGKIYIVDREHDRILVTNTF